MEPKVYRLLSKLSLIVVLSAISLIQGCTSLDHAAKSSTSLFNFLGFSELPDWYIRSKYRYSDSKWIENDFNTELHYRDVGEGPVIILLHSEIASLHVWEKWIEILSENFRVIAVDLPGSGLTSAPHCMKDKERTCAENLSIDYVSHTIEYFIEDLGINKFSLIGSSYSGYLAAQYAGHQHPEKLDKLILISPIGFQQELPWVLNYVTTNGMDTINKYFQPSAVITRIVEDFYGDPAKVSSATVQRYLHLAQSEGARESNVQQLMFVRRLMEHGMLLDLSDIEIPTLVMWGESNKWSDPTLAEKWSQQLANATLVTYPIYGHALMEEGPEITSADVVAFINEEPLPTLDSVGSEGFSIDDAMGGLDREALFGAPSEDSSEEVMMEDVE